MAACTSRLAGGARTGTGLNQRSRHCTGRPRLAAASAQRESTLGGGGFNLRGLLRMSMSADQPLEFLRRQRCAEMKPLVLIAAELLQKCDLLSGFNALGNHFQIQT